MIFRKKEPSIEVIIGSESSIKGDLISKGLVRMDGTIDGNINADWLIVGETGAVKGDVDLRGVVINGKIDGDIKSKETVDIKSKGIVEGDIEADWVMIGEAAMVKGDVALRAIIINGKIEGNIKSREIVKIKSKGIVVTFSSPKSEVLETVFAIF
jgi:cytoskeletal protein CcmA (bactofilin family)